MGARVVVQSFHTVVIDLDEQIGAALLDYAVVAGRIFARPEGYRVVAVAGRCESFQELGVVRIEDNLQRGNGRTLVRSYDGRNHRGAALNVEVEHAGRDGVGLGDIPVFEGYCRRVLVRNFFVGNLLFAVRIERRHDVHVDFLVVNPCFDRNLELDVAVAGMQDLDVDLAPLSGFDVLYLLAPIDRHIGGRFSLAGFVVLAGKDDLQGVVRIDCTEETGFERFARSFGASVNQGIVLDRKGDGEFVCFVVRLEQAVQIGGKSDRRLDISQFADQVIDRGRELFDYVDRNFAVIDGRFPRHVGCAGVIGRFRRDGIAVLR